MNSTLNRYPQVWYGTKSVEPRYRNIGYRMKQHTKEFFQNNEACVGSQLQDARFILFYQQTL
jgi:hypothetical protein